MLLMDAQRHKQSIHCIACQGIIASDFAIASDNLPEYIQSLDSLNEVFVWNETIYRIIDESIGAIVEAALPGSE